MLGSKRVCSLAPLARSAPSPRSLAPRPCSPHSLHSFVGLRPPYSLRSQWAWALTLHELLVTQKGRSPKDLAANAAATKLVHNMLLNTSFDGASGKVQFDPATGDRLGLTIVIRNQVDGVEKTIARYQEGAFTPASMDVVWWFDLTSGNKSLSSGEGRGVVPRDRSPLQQPYILDVAPRIASPFGGETLTIVGRNFRAGTLAVTVGGKVCRSPMLLSPSTISCITPAGEGAELDVQVSIDGINIKGTTLFTFAYTLPQVSTISRYLPNTFRLDWGITPYMV